MQATIELREREIAPLAEELDAARERELEAANALTAARSTLEQIFTQLREVEAAAAERATANAERRVQAENLRAQSEHADRDLEAARERAAQLAIAAGSAAHGLRERGERTAELEDVRRDNAAGLETAEREASEAQDVLAGALSSHRDAMSAVTGAESRLHTIEELENNLEGHVPGTRAVVEAWQRGELSGIEGIVSNVVTIDERYARAMDVAFGARLSNVVTTTSEGAERCIEFLNRKEAGRATFLPLDTLRNREGRVLPDELGRVPGVIGYAHALVETDERFRSIVNFLVGNVLIVDRLQTGIELVRARGLRDTVVTLGGEQITGGGAITGGRFQRERSILSRRVQARTLRETLIELRANLARGEAALQAAHERAQTAIDTRENERRALANLDLQMAELRAQAAAAATEAQRTETEAAAASARVEELAVLQRESREQRRAAETIAVAGDETDADRTRLEGDLARARSTIGHAEERQVQAASRASDIRERLAALAADRDAARARLGILDVRRKTRHRCARIDAGRHRNAGRRDALAARSYRGGAAWRQRRRCGARTRSARSRSHRSNAARGRSRFEAGRTDRTRGVGRGRARSYAFGRNRCGARYARIAVRGRIQPTTKSVATSKHATPASPTRWSTTCRDCAKSSRVWRPTSNLNAEAERDEVNERQTFLRTQMDDLTAARETLLESIREIELQTQAQFNETFAKVAGAFANTFAEIFPGGTA